MTTTTVTFSAHLLPEYTNDPEVMSLLSDPEFGNMAVSLICTMIKYTKDKNGSIPASALGDARVVKMIESIRQDSDMKRAVLEERLANERTKYEERISMLEDLVACERAANGKMTAVQRGRDGERAVINMMQDEFKYSPYDIVDASEMKHESDIHIVDRNTGARIVVEVKNIASAVNTGDVRKSVGDVKFCRAKYGENLAGYLFVSLRGNKRIPTKGVVSTEIIDGITVVWLSIDAGEIGIEGARAMISRMIGMMHSMHKNGLTSPDHPINVENGDSDEVTDLKERLSDLQKVWNDDMDFMHSVCKTATDIEKKAKGMRLDAKKALVRRNGVLSLG